MKKKSIFVTEGYLLRELIKFLMDGNGETMKIILFCFVELHSSHK